jgi:dCTP deaminase
MLVTGKELVHLVDNGLLDPVSPVQEEWSIPLHLGAQFLEYHPVPDHPVVPPRTIPTRPVPLNGDGELILRPGAAVLGCTSETVRIPLENMAWISTKGSVARGFLAIHSCDGQVDPGFVGKITLELVNQGPLTLALRPGMAIANLYLWELKTPLRRGYKGRFWGADGPTPMIEQGASGAS